MKISYYLFFLVCILIGQYAWSGAWDFPSAAIAEVIITGSGANLQVTQGPVNSPVKIMVSGPFENRWSSVIEAEKLKLQNASDANTNGQETSIQIQLPAGKKLTVALNEGKLNLGPQIGGVFVRILKGQVVAQKTTENLQIYIQKGDVQVDSHQGDLNIESYSAKVVVKNSQGDLEISNFMGESVVERAASRVNIQSRLGNARILMPKAGVNFNWGLGQLSVSDLVGRCEGNLEEGSLTVSELPDSELEVRAIKGKIQVNLPSSSGAWLNLRTSSTELVVPSPLKPAKDAKYSVVKGRLSGTNKGSVVIHGEETSVVVR
jgi:hypothetical protein